ncbi:MAG: efflux transporter periplasmic adaptor subunit, partial [Bacteroidia bacterium]
SATVDIHTKRVVNVLSLPIQAITTRSDRAIKGKDEKKKQDDGEARVVDEKKEKLEMNNAQKDLRPQECVFILDNGKVRLQKVKTGIQDNIAIEITEGLKEGDEVVNGPYNAVAKLLKNGMEVKKSDKGEIVKQLKKE